MLPRMKILLLVALPCLIFSLRVDAVGQVGRLVGTVAYTAPGSQPVAARGVRVIAAGSYSQSETRTDNNGTFVMILRPGGYRIVAQGAYGFVQYQEVGGYVTANADSYINPNPLFLVPQSGRNSDSPRSPPLIQTAAMSVPAKGAHQNGLTFEIASENSDTGDTGDLLGTVKYKQGYMPANNIEVWAIGNRERRPVKTDPNGNFAVRAISPGKYTICVVDPNFKQEVAVVGYVVKGKNNSFISPNPILLLPDKSAKPCPGLITESNAK